MELPAEKVRGQSAKSYRQEKKEKRADDIDREPQQWRNGPQTIDHM
jgi:hypothetical protein